jgi:hypothetical protein
MLTLPVAWMFSKYRNARRTERQNVGTPEYRNARMSVSEGGRKRSNRATLPIRASSLDPRVLNLSSLQRLPDTSGVFNSQPCTHPASSTPDSSAENPGPVEMTMTWVQKKGKALEWLRSSSFHIVRPSATRFTLTNSKAQDEFPRQQPREGLGYGCQNPAP